VNQFLISSSDIVGTLLSLSGSEARHAIQVLRVRKGDTFLATDGKGLQVKAEITDLQKDSLLAEIVKQKQDSEPSSHVTIALGLLKKRDRLEFALEKLTELGVHRIILFEADHSERNKARVDRLELIVQSALKQSLGSWLPKLNLVNSLEEIFKVTDGDTGSNSVRETSTRDARDENSKLVQWDEIYLADETLDKEEGTTQHGSFSQISQQSSRTMSSNLDSFIESLPERLLIVGPEGGFSKRERDWIAECHPEYKSVSLGSRRLRAETAAIAGLLSLSTHD